MESIFYPGDQLWNDEEVREAVVANGNGFIFTNGHLLEFGDGPALKGILPHTANWAGVEPTGTLYHGSINSYKRFDGEKWESFDLDFPAHDLIWSKTHGFALTNDGIHAVSPDLEMTMLYASDQVRQLLGAFGACAYAVTTDDAVLKVDAGGGGVEKLPFSFAADELQTATGDGFILISDGEKLYRLFRDDRLEALPVAEGWTIGALGTDGGSGYVAFENTASGEWAVGRYAGTDRAMVAVPYADVVGRPSHLLGNGERFALVGENGVGWYAMDELTPVAEPAVSFDLFFEDKRVADRTIPNGMHYIDLKVNFEDPEIPSIVQSRINGKRWVVEDLRDPSLLFPGHGNFEVELRAVHPNGVTSPPRRIRFGIAPPWYLNPLYQGLLIVLFIAAVWGIYILRHAQLKKTNLWLENEVKKQTRELEAATAARTNFLAGLSHDIRNPLNGVLMIAETLSRDPPKNGEDSRLKDLTEFGVIVDRMLGEILDFSAIDQTSTPMAFIPVSITDILSSSVKQNQYSIQEALVNITVSVPEELRAVVIKTDRNWMIKILSNLIINALEYSESERIEVGAVCHRLTDRDVEMEIYVKDWGKGIDEAEKGFVFDRFYRGESGIESGKHGTGLGLSICQEIAHAMGAHLSLTDNDPSGCCFVLKGRFERVAGARELDREAVLQELHGKNVLVVDDLLYNRRSIVDFFTTIGCTCDQCENGREALEKLGSNAYDLALLDWDLPGLMGPEVAKRHRRNHPDDAVIIIALTAYTDGEKKRISEEAGMNGYISKPLTASRLAYCLANITDHKPESTPQSDRIDTDELDQEIYNHIRECLAYGEQYEWENLRRCAHRLTTLALMRNNPAMQQVCRDLQVSAQSENADEVRIGLAELQQWGQR